MANSGGRSIGQEVNAWVQTVGILIAAAWGVYTFVYKEMIEPKSAPINISVDLELKKVGAADVTKRGTKKRLIPVELRSLRRTQVPGRSFFYRARGLRGESRSLP